MDPSSELAGHPRNGRLVTVGLAVDAGCDILDGHLRGCVADAVGAGEIEIGDVAEEVLAAVSGAGPPAARTEHRAVP